MQSQATGRVIFPDNRAITHTNTANSRQAQSVWDSDAWRASSDRWGCNKSGKAPDKHTSATIRSEGSSLTRGIHRRPKRAGNRAWVTTVIFSYDLV